MYIHTYIHTHHPVQGRSAHVGRGGAAGGGGGAGGGGHGGRVVGVTQQRSGDQSRHAGDGCMCIYICICKYICTQTHIDIHIDT